MSVNLCKSEEIKTDVLNVLKSFTKDIEDGKISLIEVNYRQDVREKEHWERNQHDYKEFIQVPDFHITIHGQRITGFYDKDSW